jgi:hypothetical protein
LGERKVNSSSVSCVVVGSGTNPQPKKDTSQLFLEKVKSGREERGGGGEGFRKGTRGCSAM